MRTILGRLRQRAGQIVQSIRNRISGNRAASAPRTAATPARGRSSGS